MADRASPMRPTLGMVADPPVRAAPTASGGTFSARREVNAVVSMEVVQPIPNFHDEDLTKKKRKTGKINYKEQSYGENANQGQKQCY